MVSSIKKGTINMSEKEQKDAQVNGTHSTEESKPEFSEDEYFIMDALHYVNANKSNFIGVMLLLSDDEEHCAEHKAKMAKYLEFKGKYITEQDILKKATQITHKREQYYPNRMVVKYVGETAEQLTKDDVYWVEMVFGCEEFFLIRCDDDILREFPAELFELQEITEIEYVGYEEGDGEISITEGFELNKRYKVGALNMGQYKCDNGLSCWFYETFPVGFKKASLCVPSPFKCIDDVLRLLKDAIEFGKLETLSRYLHPECEYISQPADRKLNTKLDFIKCWREVAQNQLAKDIFCDCDFGTLEEVPEDSMFSVGTRCVISFGYNDYDVFLIKLNEEQNLITGIYVYNKQYFREKHYKIKADYQENEEGQSE